MEWHRAYQNLQQDRVREARLAADYDAMLQADPANSALLYLRGRVSATRDESLRFFERAVTADSRNPYPLYAQGHDRMGRGDWAGARTLLQAAAALRPDDATFAHYLAVARFALGEYAALEQEYHNQLKREPLNVPVNVQLCDVLLAGGKREDASQLVTAFERAASAKHAEAARAMNSYFRRHFLYATGDFAGLERHAKGDNSDASSRFMPCWNRVAWPRH